MVLAHGVLSPTKKARTTAQKICNNQLEKNILHKKLKGNDFLCYLSPHFLYNDKGKEKQKINNNQLCQAKKNLQINLLECNCLLWCVCSHSWLLLSLLPPLPLSVQLHCFILHHKLAHKWTKSKGLKCFANSHKVKGGEINGRKVTEVK